LVNDKYYKKFDFFYKRTCFRLMSEFYKHLFAPFQKQWVEQRKPLSQLLHAFATKHFAPIFTQLNGENQRAFTRMVMAVVHSHRHNKDEEGDAAIDFSIVRDTMYKYSKQAQRRFFSHSALAFLFAWFAASGGLDFVRANKYLGKEPAYLERIHAEMDELKEEALRSLAEQTRLCTAPSMTPMLTRYIEVSVGGARC
jgi:hypothetical protein